MPDPTSVNAQIVDVINQTQVATMSPQVVLTSGAGRAHAAVAQAAAIAIQDSADALRNASTVATAAAGTALAQFLASGDPRYLEALGPARDMVDKAIADYVAISAASAKIVKEFPSG